MHCIYTGNCGNL